MYNHVIYVYSDFSLFQPPRQYNTSRDFIVQISVMNSSCLENRVMRNDHSTATAVVAHAKIVYTWNATNFYIEVGSGRLV